MVSIMTPFEEAEEKDGMKRPGEEPLSRMAYPGRLVALGRDAADEFNIVIYALTGRSPSSQARKMVIESNKIWTKPTDPVTFKTENPDLLVYPAVILDRGIAVSNGQQTADIDVRSGQSPIEVLDLALKDWSYEPDAPIYTPRISGCILSSNRAALSVVKRVENGDSLRFFFEVPLIAGKGKFVATYAGENKDPLPPFHGEPLDLKLSEKSVKALVEAVYGALKPAAGDVDFRVAVACIFAQKSDMTNRQIAIINRHERTST